MAILKKDKSGLTRRDFLIGTVAGGLLGASGGWVLQHEPELSTPVFIGKARDYEVGIAEIILSGMQELQVTEQEIRGKTVLIKPNLVEVHAGLDHINTHPMVVRGTGEAFLQLGAARVVVGEAAGHRRDSLLVLEESGLGEVLREDRISFIDLNNDELVAESNLGRRTDMTEIYFPAAVRRADIVVSVAKMKTHHWAGATLSMKNLFGVMPGIVYGWPKNVLHHAGIEKSILDINATLRPHFAIVDGIIGMEGDGPIMGEPKHAGLLVMGRNLPAVDATCARVMGIDPHHIKYLRASSGWLGPIRESRIEQRGETVADVRTDFALLEQIPAQRGIRLAI